VDKINEVRPHIVFSFGSYADEFFHYVADRKPQVALPKVWMYGGDMMSRQGRVIAEEKLGCIVYSTYNSIETGKLGFECERRRGFHLNVDYCAVRLVDESGRDVPPGTTGEIVISNLYNRAMVLLNYRMGDIGVMAAEPCPCGRNLPLLAHLSGKKMEFVRFANGVSHIREVLELLFERELTGALQSQLRQRGPSDVLWQIVPASTINRTALERAILEKSRASFGEGVDVEVQFVEKIERRPGGKLFKVVRS
jgi:phenylacetate-CoA ligase